MAMVLTLALSSLSAAQVIVGGYPYPAYRYAARDSAVRFDVKPNETAVYLDGYYAGVVDDFDGWYQRLYTAPGGHEITLYLEGYRTYTERVYLSPDNTFKMHHRMEKLPAGEVSERPPAPPPPQFEGQATAGRARRCRDATAAVVDRRQLPAASARSAAAASGAAPNEGERGTLALSVQPNDAEVLVDGTPWRGQNQDRLAD